MGKRKVKFGVKVVEWKKRIGGPNKKKLRGV